MTKQAVKHYEVGKIEDMTKMASVLKNHIVNQKLFSTIKGKNYAHVEGWQFAGGMMGLFPRVVNVENLSSSNEIKWKASVELVNSKDNFVVGNGFALCSNKEVIKKGFDEYAILSMAQTRAIGKAYRNLVGWVMKLAGYEATPVEEMVKVGNTPVTSEYIVEGKKSENPVVAFECSSCGNPMSLQEKNYSVRIYKKQLCRDCQKESKKE